MEIDYGLNRLSALSSLGTLEAPRHLEPAKLSQSPFSFKFTWNEHCALLFRVRLDQVSIAFQL